MASRARQIDLVFPLAGVDRRFAFQDQAPYSTPDALNVRPLPAGEVPSVNLTMDRRERGGCRPGLGKGYTTLLGGGSPVRMINTVTPIDAGLQRSWLDDFLGATLNPVWKLPTGANWDTHFPGRTLPKIPPTNLTLLVDPVTDAPPRKMATVRDDFEYDPLKPYSIELTIPKTQGDLYGRAYVFLGMQQTTPDPWQDGIVLAVTLRTGGVSGAISGSMEVRKGGVHAAGSPFALVPVTDNNDGTIRVSVAGRSIRVWWVTSNATTLLLDQVIAAAEMPTGRRFGFGGQLDNLAEIIRYDAFKINYTVNEAVQLRGKPIIVASAGGKLYREKPGSPSEMELVPGSILLNADAYIQSVERFGKLYIADHGPVKIRGADGTMLAPNGSNKPDAMLTASGIDDWTIYGIDPNRDLVYIEELGGSGVTTGVFEIELVSQGGLKLKSRTTASNNLGTGACSYRVEPGPKIYDAMENKLSHWVTDRDASDDSLKGSVPLGCPLIALFRDRLVLGGPTENPSIWFMSRQGDPHDFLYGQDDAGTAVAGNSGDSGRAGEPLTAIISHTDDYLVLAGPSSLNVLRGDPAAGGQIDNVSRVIGVAGKKAWAYGPVGEIIFFSYDGLYLLPPGAQGFPSSVSKQMLPDDLKIPDLDRDKFEILLEYDVRDRGVHIFATQTGGTLAQGKHYWLSWFERSFWPVRLPLSIEPTAICSLNSQWGADSSVIIGSRDGYLRFFRDAFFVDVLGNNSTVEIESYVWIGPIRSREDSTGVVTEIDGVLADDSGDVVWSLHTGPNPESAFLAPAFASGIWKEGSNYISRPRMAFKAFYLKLAGRDQTPPAQERPWAFEKARATLLVSGKQRLP